MNETLLSNGKIKLPFTRPDLQLLSVLTSAVFIIYREFSNEDGILNMRDNQGVSSVCDESHLYKNPENISSSTVFSQTCVLKATNV